MKTRFFVLTAILGAGLGVGGASLAKAQATTTSGADKPVYVSSDSLKQVSDKPDGWSYAFTLAANLNVASNRDVVGQVDGNAVLVGGSAIAGVTYLRGRHQWLNTGSINEAWSRTPALNRVVKSTDVVDLQTLYNFFVNPYTGPFARLALQTGLVKTDRVTAAPVTYVRDGVPTETVTTSRLRLSDSFQPFTLSESVGWFAQPVRSEPVNLTGRVGFGGRHTFADGVIAVTGDEDDAGNTLYQRLTDVHQAGAELFAGLDGKQLGGKVLYSVGLTALFPLISNDDTDRSIVALTRVGLSATLGMSVVSWLSVNYALKVVRDPQLIDTVQVQNTMLLSLQYARSSYTPPKAPEKLSPATEARITALEERAKSAEQRAAAAEAAAAGGASTAGEPTLPLAPPEPPATPTTPPKPDPRVPAPQP
ncbi:MAG: hypothetical protein ABW252_18510 [Polyangiales bacterium]